MNNETIRVIYAREHTTIWPGLGVFLAGPTPPEDRMTQSWRRQFAERLVADERLDPTMSVVVPEPEECSWRKIRTTTGNRDHDRAVNKQIPWELQYLSLCDVTVFWFASYWTDECGGSFPGNIGPTTRLEFGYYLQEYLKAPKRRSFIVGSPDDAQSTEWARQITQKHRIPWHSLAVEEKDKLIPDTMVEATVQALLEHRTETED